MEDPILTWYDCRRCGQVFHIFARHKDGVEDHHRTWRHAGADSRRPLLKERE